MNEALWRWLDRLYLGLSRPLGRAARTQALLREPFVQNPPLVAPPTQGRIVVLAPHPDDEAIGCGGTLRLAALGGAEVHCLLMTGGELGDAAGAPGETARVRRAEMQACAGLLGLTAVHELSGRDQRLAGRPELVDEMRNYLLELQPVALFLPFYMDAHIDHRPAWKYCWRPPRQRCRPTFRCGDTRSGRPVRPTSAWTSPPWPRSRGAPSGCTRRKTA